MRFLANGPSIPGKLLELRDEGHVVFLCGAGVSMPAGLSSFDGLTRSMVDQLGVPTDSEIRDLLDRKNEANGSAAGPPYDQIFGMLQREYSRTRVESEVSNALKTPRNASRRCHKIIIRLSSDKAGRPFVITTNFDLLFERARKGIQRWIPPHLPDMKASHTHQGVVYLHGRRRTSRGGSSELSGLILSSSDFGRAYLADGWATRFVKHLLEQKFLVLLGYSAGDPPVRYLLEGLDASPSATRERIFAFDRGEPSKVKMRWDNLGVTAIPCIDYELLWDSLEEWTNRADDAMQWKYGVARLAQQSPRSLRAFERGQVAALVATRGGARAFANAEPPPPAEWLCVFDNSVRFHDNWQDLETGTRIDPSTLYGLDDDPPRPPYSPYRPEPAPGIDLIRTLPEDECRCEDRLSNIIPARSRRGNERLEALRFWLSRVAHEPTAIWWAVRQAYLHPGVVEAISWRLQRGSPRPIEGEARRIWELLLEIESDKPADPDDFRWSAACDSVEIAGWKPRTLRQIERALRPRLEARLSRALPAPPALADATMIDLTKLVQFEVKFPSINDGKVEIDQESLPEFFKVVRRSFERGISLLSETGVHAEFFHLAAIEPEKDTGNRHVDPEGPDPVFLWSLRLFDQLAEHHPEAARREALAWPDPDRFFFDKLRIYVWTKTDIFSSREIAKGIVNLSEQTFWDGYLKRELLHLLRAQWAKLPKKSRRDIERRLLKGRSRYRLEESDKYEDRRDTLSGSRLGWLEREGCQLSKMTLEKLRKLRSRSDWRSSWAESADGDMNGRAGSVEKLTDARELESLPIRRIAERARELSGEESTPFIEHVPFEGLVKERPRQALRVLTFEARNGRYPTDLWETTLGNWPEDEEVRPKRVLARRLAAAPRAVLLKVRFAVVDWISKHLAHSQDLETEMFLAWDAMFAALVETAPNSTQSYIGEVTSAEGRESSRKTYYHALNSSVGQLVRALLNTLAGQDSTPCPLDSEISARLGRASLISGEGADHAISIMAEKLHWFFWKDPAWTRENLLSAFALGSPRCEAAWRGYLLERRSPAQNPELFELLKPSLLGLLEGTSNWPAEAGFDRNVCWYLIIATYSKRHDVRYLEADECRRALQHTTDQGRQSALWALGKIIAGEDGWSVWAREFFRNIWPQETKFQTDGTTSAMIDIAVQNPAKFRDIINVVLDYLQPQQRPHGFLYQCLKETDGADGPSLAERYPLSSLTVADSIIGPAPENRPYDLGTFLERIADVDQELKKSTSWRRLYELAHG